MKFTAFLLIVALAGALAAPLDEAPLRVKRQACNNFFGCLINIFKPPMDQLANLPAQIQNQANTAFGTAVSNMMKQLQDAMFQQQTLDFKQMTSKFLDDIKNSITNGLKQQASSTSQQMTDATFQSALQFVNDQINSLKIVAANSNMGQFTTALTNSLTAIQNNLQGVFPAISSLINTQINQFISSMNFAIPIPNLG